jgi:ATP-binding cassette, subfamily B, multidrug efflux pump
MKSLRYLNKYLLKYRWRLVLGVFFVAISNLFAIFPAQIIRHAFDLVSETIDIYKLHRGFRMQQDIYEVFARYLLYFGIIVLAMALIKGLFMFLMRQTIIVMSRLIEYDLKNEIFDYYQKLSLSFYRRNSTGDMMARVTEDVSRVRMYLGPAIMYTINLVVLFILVVTTMVIVNPVLTFYVLLPLPVLSLSIYFIQSVINEMSERVQNQLSVISTYTQEAFSGIRVLKSFVRENKSTLDFAAECDEYRRRSVNLARVDAFFQPLMLLLIGLSTLLTVYVGGLGTIAGEITVGNIAEFIIYVNMLTWPVAALGWVTSLVQRAAASQERINEFLKTEPEIKSPHHQPEKINGKIEFKNVGFIYPDSGITALKNVSFTIEPGKSLAVLGRTGSGKSTIASLITRSFDPTKGIILIDDKDVKEHNLEQLRDKIGYVPQDVFLFSDTIANNIAFGLKEIGDDKIMEKIEKAARNSVVHENILEFPNGYETRMGERGITLSGGQKQRVSIARALVKDPKILILDDCLSAVDTKTEERILKNLRSVIEQKTSIIISHRVSTVKHIDHIIVLDEGNITEEGNHRELMNKKGMYYQLYQKQLMEEEERES